MERRENSRFDLQCLCATEKTFKFYVKEKNSAKAVNEDYVRLLRVCNSFPELTVSLSRRNLKTLKEQTVVTKLPRLEASVAIFALKLPR